MGGGGNVPAVGGPQIEDEAAAVGDPHMSLNTGAMEDLCCTAGVCTPCSSVSLISHKANIEEKLHQGLADAIMYAQSQPRRMGGGIMGGGMMGGGGNVPAVGGPQIEDEAAAVGDPHMSLNTGAKEDLCCTGGKCEPCDVSLFAHSAQTVDIANKLHQGLEDARLNIAQQQSQPRGMMGGMMGGRMGGGGNVPAVGGPQIDDGAAAVGDPHMIQSNGAREDLCCDNGECLPCAVEFLEQRQHLEQKFHEGLNNVHMNIAA